MADTKIITIPITGMTCANCVATVERSIKKVNGVQQATVNLSSERATVEFDPSVANLASVIDRVEKAGYGVAEAEAELQIQGLSDDNDVRRIEKVITGLQGVETASINLVTGKAQISYIPTIISQKELRTAVKSAGFDSLELGGNSEDAEAKARQFEIDQQKKFLIVGFDLHHSIVPHLHGQRPGFLPHVHCPCPMDELVNAGTGYPGSILCRPPVLCRSIQIAA